ncbi:MAG: Gfo/Idh/MocA family protein [Chloroflexota bacterium]
MTTKVRLGILGTGFIARTYHVPALMQVHDAKIVALSNPRVEKARELADTIGLDGGDCYREAEEVLERSDVDAVLILTPNDTHRDLTLAAARHGKHALVQKPLARGSAECAEMIAAAKEAGIVLAGSFMHRFLPEVRMARDLLEKGTIGRLFTMRVRNAVTGSTWAAWFHDRDRTGGGAAIDVGVHGIDLIRYLAGDIENVQARMGTYVPQRPLDGAERTTAAADNEDTVLATYGLASGAIALHEAAWTERAMVRRFEAELRGEAGAILIRSGYGPLALASRHLDNGDQWILPFVPYEPLGMREHQAFIDAVLGRAAVQAPASDGLAAVRVAEALYRSAQAGRVPVEVGS